MAQDIELRLKWRHTWPEEEREDYVAEVHGYAGAVGRIYVNIGGPTDGLWFWSLTAFGPEISRNAGKASGYEPSAREAARQVEAAWLAAIRGSSFDVPSVPAQPRNAYAVAKGRG